MEQQKEQPKQDYAKYDAPGYPPQPSYAQPQPGYGPTPPPVPQYGQVQPYPNRQYAPYPYRRTRGPVLPLLIIAAVILIMLGIAVGTSFLSVGKDYTQSIPSGTANATVVHITADSVDLTVTSAADAGSSIKFDANNVATFDLTPGGNNDINLNVKAPQGFLFTFKPSKVQVTIPAGVSVDLNTGSGDVNISGAGNASGQVKAQTGSGDMKVANAQGSTSLQTGSGDIELDGMKSGDLNLQTGSGSIKATSASPKQNLNIHSGSGDIDYSGDIAATSYAETGSGDITFHINSGNQFAATFDTGSGDISNDFGLASGKHVTGNTVTETPASSLLSLTIKTGSGDINVLKGQ